MATFRELVELMMPMPMEELRETVPEPTGEEPKYPMKPKTLGDIEMPGEKIAKGVVRGTTQIMNETAYLAQVYTDGFYQVGDETIRLTPEKRKQVSEQLTANTTRMVLDYIVTPKAVEGLMQYWKPQLKTFVKSILEKQKEGINLAKPAYRGVGPAVKPGYQVDLDEILKVTPEEEIPIAKPKLPREKPTYTPEEIRIIREPPGKILKEPITGPEPLIKKVYPATQELGAGFDINYYAGYVDKKLWQQKALPKIQNFIQEKTKPFLKEFVELDDAQKIAGMPDVMHRDKPWWSTIKSVFGKAEGQEGAIKLVRGAERSLYREHRRFMESPLWKNFLALTPEERIGVRAVTEGRASEIPSMRQQVKDVIQMFRNADVKETTRLLKFSQDHGYGLTEDMLKARKLQPLMKLTGQSSEQLIAKGVDVDQLVYWRHFSPDHWKSWLGRYLKKPIKGYKAGYLKRSTGAWDYLDDAINDPAITVPVQNAERTEHAIRMELIDDIKSTFGKTIPESGELLPGYSRFEPKGHIRWYPVGEVKGEMAFRPTTKTGAFQVPSAVAQELNYTLGSSERWEKVCRMTIDKVTHAWRTSVLALSPRWVVNNTAGNITLNALGEVSPASYYKTTKLFGQARQLMKTQGISLESALENLGVTDDVFMGLYGTEAGASLRSIGVGRGGIRSTIGKIGDIAGWVPSKVYRINSINESFARTAHYLDKVGKGLTHEQAVKSVNQFLFDYGALSWAERSIVRRVVPFYAWTKNITRLAMTYPVRNPTRTAAMGLGAKLGTDYLRDNFGVILDWKEQKLKIPTDDGQSYLVVGFRGANPFSDIVTPLDLFTSEGMSGLLSKLAPWVKVPIERGTATQIMPWGAQPWTAPVTEKDEYGREKRPTPNLPRHVALQFPQFQTLENITKPYAKYTATGEIIVGKGGRIYPRNPALDILRLFGANITTEDLADIRKRGMLDEYNNKQEEKQWMYYKKKKEIILGDYKKFKELSEGIVPTPAKGKTFQELAETKETMPMQQMNSKTFAELLSE